MRQARVCETSDQLQPEKVVHLLDSTDSLMPASAAGGMLLALIFFRKDRTPRSLQLGSQIRELSPQGGKREGGGGGG